MVDAKGGFRLAQEQVSVVPEVLIAHLQDLRFGSGFKVDQHVTKEDEISPRILLRDD